jgi:diguanylate cyclase (GGDEF)-like protein
VSPCSRTEALFPIGDNGAPRNHRHTAARLVVKHRLPLLLASACAMGLLLAHAAHSASHDGPAALIERSRSAMRTDPEHSRKLAEQALAALATQPTRPNVDLQIRAYTLLCDYHSERNRAEAMRQLDAARALLAQATRRGLRAGLLTCEGELHEYAGDSAQAAALYEQAVTAAEASGEDELLGEALFKRGYLRGMQGDFARGLADLRRALGLYERLRLPHHVQTTINGVAVLYNRMGDYAQARHYYEASLRAQAASGATREVIVTHNNLGRVLENLADWDAAQRAFETVQSMSREMGYERGVAYGLRGLASVHNARGAPAEAIKLIDQALTLLQQAPDERLRGQLLLQRGIALRSLQRPSESVLTLQQALAIFRRADSMPEMGLAHGELARSLTVVGDWRSAYEHAAQFKGASDSLLRRQLDERFATLRIEFDTAARERENALLQREKEATERALEQEKRATQLQAAVLGLLVILAGVLAALAWRHRRTSRAMHTLAMTDELTGLPNRRHALARLEATLAARAGCTLLIVDIDHFKSINDVYGHLVGDDILRVMAAALQATVRTPGAPAGAAQSIALGRLGGEEFVLVLPGADETAAQESAQRLLDAARRLDVSPWLPSRSVTVSVGLTLSVEGDTVSQMLRRADEALYAAKASGRNCAVLRTAQHVAHERERQTQLEAAEPAAIALDVRAPPVGAADQAV